MEILGLGWIDVDISDQLEGKCGGGGYVNEEFYRLHSIYMKENNPMYRPEIRKKVSETMKGKPGRKLYDWERELHSKRMKENNPTKMNPACTNTAHPINIHYSDGTVDRYDYMKLAAEKTGIPYGTLQHCLLKERKCPKWNIEKVERLEKDANR